MDEKLEQAKYELNEPPAWELAGEPSHEAQMEDAAAFLAAAASFKRGK